MRKKPERLTAYHGLVEVIHWEYTSNQGARIKLGLQSRDELKHFDEVTRRNAKRAGQRYRLFWQTEEGDTIEAMPTEGWFCLASWSHAQGASIVLNLHPDDLDLIDGLTTRDQRDERVGHQCYLALVEIQDDEEPVDQAQRALVEQLPATPSRPKGGPISKNAGMLSGDKDFQLYVAQIVSQEVSEIDAEYCAAYIRGICHVESRALLDHDDHAKNRYETLVKRPFLKWGENVYA